MKELTFHIEIIEVKKVIIIKTENKLCHNCMEKHEVQTVVNKDTEEFKGIELSFDATYEYCDNVDGFLETEEMIKANSLAMKDAYRIKENLLTSSEIVAIRDKYSVSQKDFSEILDWGMATITRYENHQVQDRAHDDILRKIKTDPKWFLDMLKRADGRISEKASNKYYQAASIEFRKMKNEYLMDSIQAVYANYRDYLVTGGAELNLNKVVEIINYYASKVNSLHKVKLMKMLWYSDSLSYKRNGRSITGLVYKALPMGAVPEGYEQIIDLDGVEFDTLTYGEDLVGYKFKPVKDFDIKELTSDEIKILDVIIKEVGNLNSKEIIKKMHGEDAYKNTSSNCIISFTYAEKLSIQ